MEVASHIFDMFHEYCYNSISLISYFILHSNSMVFQENWAAWSTSLRSFKAVFCFDLYVVAVSDLNPKFVTFGDIVQYFAVSAYRSFTMPRFCKNLLVRLRITAQSVWKFNIMLVPFVAFLGNKNGVSFGTTSVFNGMCLFLLQLLNLNFCFVFFIYFFYVYIHPWFSTCSLCCSTIKYS